MFCPKCGTPMFISDNHRDPLSWCVCPKDGYSTYSITAFLKNYNLTTEEAIQMINDGKKLPVDTTEYELQVAEIAHYCRHNIGRLQGWSLEQYFQYGKSLDDGSTKPYREPPLLCVCNKFLEVTKPFTRCVSTKNLDLGSPIGINVPIFQEQSQYVGQCTLFKDRKGGFAWKTYLLDMYTGRERGFLSYRPRKVKSTDEIVMVDNFAAYIQMLYWYDTAKHKASEVFPYNVIPVLALGETDVALNYLFDYFWNPARITLASPRVDTLNALWTKIQEPTRLQCNEIRVMTCPNSTAGTFRNCRSRDEFEELVNTKFHTMSMDYDEYKLKKFKAA